MSKVHLLDYVAGNVRSLVNAVEKLGYQVEWIQSPEDVKKAEKLILPGVGHFGHCVTQLSKGGFLEPIREHIQSGKPFMGICVGLQVLCQGSAEAPGVKGLGLVPATLTRFNSSNKSVPHIGWNSAQCEKISQGSPQTFFGLNPESRYYYVHSYAIPYGDGLLSNGEWAVATATYVDETFVGAISRKNVFATQFHPEKSGAAGLRTLHAFLAGENGLVGCSPTLLVPGDLTRRIIACLDVRANDEGDLVVTKGDKYDVREKNDDAGRGKVRNLGKPVDMARKYYQQGADEIVFLNITSFRNCPLADAPMLEILRQTAETVFVPLTIGGGIRDTVDTDGAFVSALDVATMYFKSGADKVSIGSDAVIAAEKYHASGKRLSGTTAIETISGAYGNQAVVVSVDPRRVYVSSPSDTRHHTIWTEYPDDRGNRYCWYECTIKGGREGRDIDVKELVEAVEAMGAGEILLNCIDKDGSSNGFDLELIRDVKSFSTIPIIASSGAGSPAHFKDVFEQTTADAALGAGMFHRGTFSVSEVKSYLQENGLVIRSLDNLGT
ncbi:imidazole glycerol phosphate synthase hisHF [Coccidioides immitis RS]|uniref:Imidazole glycerol phosphate synthase hisHF n=2 Tax=Coccidioides immitis TaxID=5501 RepID=J3K9W5_COCIM|nr:imidazole glycerol phosphate synthase hisHF [Coccidioides immitis RS]EAS31747.3 imidazole glycerol phosphate synthase hisHF [Coccidioides immitis RS]KMP04410.1 imidazole glycerol phosphate synthase hisHF [Coccidioides immitis RMSCC 2394]TPX24483.1 Histidine biosynthesis bifunctional protein hisB [Coccidioides immitis]